MSYNKCKAIGCNKSHQSHFCRSCGDSDLNHLSSKCKKSSYNHNGYGGIATQFKNQNNPQQNFIESQPQEGEELYNQLQVGQITQNSQLEYILPWEDLDGCPDWIRIKSILHGIVDQNLLTSDIVKESIEEICSIRQGNNIDGNFSFETLKIAIDQFPGEGNVLESIQMAAKLALKMQTLFKHGLPILGSKQNQIVQLTSEQCACLVSNMFFCTLHLQPDGYKFPRFFTMSKLFQNNERGQVKIEKIKCLLNYFLEIQKHGYNDQHVTFKRSCLQPQNITERFKTNNFKTLDFISKEIWNNCIEQLCELTIKTEGKIEDEKEATLVDFANMFIGGGVLNHGCVQEEILFLIYPQLLASMVITQKLEGNESLFVGGARRYNDYKGYSNSFLFNATNVDQLEQDFICIDAQDYNGAHFQAAHNQVQYTEREIIRELTKSFIGFKNGSRQVLSTGRWGCGAFRGDWQLKLIIQWLAASVIGYKKMIFYNVMNQQSEEQIKLLEATLFQVKKFTVGQLHEHIQIWAKKKMNNSIFDSEDLLKYLDQL